MTKIAIYARYSSAELQTDRSIEDQVRMCRERCAANGWEVVECFADHGISGSSMMRPGLQRMLADAYDHRFDIIVTEGVDRVSRDLEDIAGIYKRLKFAGVRLVTLSEGEVNEMIVGMAGTIANMYLQKLGDNTRRGQVGRALAGKNTGGRCYGYNIVKRFNADGEQVRGDRVINEFEAGIINRIFAETDRGKSAEALAKELNAEGIPSPRGGKWANSTIRGNRRRHTGILNCELYIGVQLFNRSKFQKRPGTKYRVSRLNDESQWVRVEVPEFRIVEQELWDAVKARQKALDAVPRFSDRRRAPKLLSFLLKCGDCGSGFSKVSATHYGCSAARNKGTCDNRLTIHQQKLEEHVLGALRTRLMEPKLCEVFCAEYTRAANRFRMESNASRAQHEAEIEKADREIERLIEAIKGGCDLVQVRDHLNGTQRRREELERLLEDNPSSPVLIHPNMAHRFHVQLQQLIQSLNMPEERMVSAEILRGLIDRIVLTPNDDKSALVVDLFGHLAGILRMAEHGEPRKKAAQHLLSGAALDSEVEQAKRVAGLSGSVSLFDGVGPSKGKVVAGVGFEPTTFRL